MAALARLPLTLNDPGLRLVSALLIVGGAGLYLADILGRDRRIAVTGLVVALCADQVLRALGRSLDWSLYPGWMPVQVLLSAGVVWLAWRLKGWWLAFSEGVSWLDGMALGAFLFLELNLLAVPAAIAGRANLSGSWDMLTVWLAPLLLVTTMLPWLPGMARWRTKIITHGGWRWLLPAIVLVALPWHGRGLANLVPYLLVQLLLMIALTALTKPGPYPVRTGGAWALAGGIFLLGSFALAFALTYPYTLPFMHGSGAVILALAGFLATLPVWAYRSFVLPAERISDAWPVWVAGALALVLVIFGSWPASVHTPSVGPVHVATYNMHYDYDTYWRLSLPAQAEAIAASGADVVLLQEVDAGRITSYSADDAGWLAHRLGMHAIYAPTVEGVTGIGLLSRYPITNVTTELLPSDLEQTAIIRATLDLGGGRLVDAYATWLGLSVEERSQQVKAALAFMAESDRPAFFGGDLNSGPTSSTYAALTQAGWADSVAAGGFPNLLTDPAVDPTERIDYIWWRGPWRVADVIVSDRLASDHRLVAVKAALP